MKRAKFDYLFYIVIVSLLLLFAVAARSQSIGQEKLTTVKIYLLDTFEQRVPLKTVNLTAVERSTVKTASLMRSTFEILLEGATDEETSQNLRSPIFGIELVSVKQVKNTVYANFKNTEIKPLDKVSALIFRQSVEKTARQFSAVKRVVIYLDGVLNFDGKAGIAPQRCE